MNNIFFVLAFVFSLVIPVSLFVLILQRIRINQRRLGEDEGLEERVLDELDVLRTQLESMSRKLDRIEEGRRALPDGDEERGRLPRGRDDEAPGGSAPPASPGTEPSP